MKAPSLKPLVNSHNEWDPLEEIIVGTSRYAHVPAGDLSWEILEQRPGLPGGPFPDRMIAETEEDIAGFIEVLTSQGIVVRRPEVGRLDGPIRTPYWSAPSASYYCPRDILLVLGDTIIETPSPSRFRYFETFAYKKLLLEYMRHGARWISAPKPTLEDEHYNDDLNLPALREVEPMFDAANILRAGRDLFYLISDSGNELGCMWLQSILGPKYRVHACHDLYSSIHIDTTLTLLRPGLVLINPSRVNERNLPPLLRSWDVIEAPKMVSVPYSDWPAISSEWLGMNFLMLSPSLAVVDKHQINLIRLLEKHRIDVIPLLLRHGGSLGGGYHCITLDVRRKGSLEDYFD